MAGEVRAEAEVRSAAAERDVVVRCSCDVEAERVLEDVLVAVRGRVPQRDAVTFGDRDAADLRRAGGPAREVRDGRRPAQDLLDRGPHRVGVASAGGRAGRDARAAR